MLISVVFLGVIGVGSWWAVNHFVLKTDDVKKDAGYEYKTVGELRGEDAEYRFLSDAPDLDDDAYVCMVSYPDIVTADVAIPSTHEGRPVVAAVGDPEEVFESRKSDSRISLSAGEGVRFIENFEDFKYLDSVELPSSLEGVYGSFNDCFLLTEIDIPAAVKQIVDSFGFSGLESVVLGGDIDRIDGSFNSCDDLKIAELDSDKGISLIKASFRDCDEIETLAVKCGVGSLAGSFFNCGELGSAVFSGPIGVIDGSFGACYNLENVVFQEDVDSLLSSFGECRKLRTVEFAEKLGVSDDSFASCSSMTEKPEKVREAEAAFAETKDTELQTFIEEKHEKNILKDNIVDSAQDFVKIYDSAIRKSVDSGALPSIFDYNGHLRSDFTEKTDQNGRRCDELDADAKLLADPSFELENVILLDEDGQVYWLSREDEDANPVIKPEYTYVSKDEDYYDRLTLDPPYAKTPEECRYLIRYQDIFSEVEPNFYQGGADRCANTTVVFVVDVKTGEVVYVHSVDTERPSENFTFTENSSCRIRNGMAYYSIDSSAARHYIHTMLY